MAEPQLEELLAAANERRRLVFEVLSLLLPSDLPRERKVRIGAPGNDACVLVDRLRPTQPVLSVGMGAPATFEQAMAGRGHAVYLVDPALDGAAPGHPAIIGFREGIAPADAPEQGQLSLAGHLDKLPAGADAPILRLDVGGAAWEVLAAAPPEVLARFEQIVLAVHFEGALGNPAFNGLVQSVLRKLVAHFTVCHVRANPFAEIRVVSGFPVLAAFELSLVRSDLVERAASATLYPTPLDGLGDHHQWREHLLWFYPFAPGSAAMRLPEDVAAAEVVALNNSGLALHNLGRWLEALQHFDRALELAPAMPGVLYNRGNTLVALERLDEAMAMYEAAQGLGPDDVGILNNRACVLGGLRRFDEALACLDQAAALKPDDPATLGNRTVLLEAMSALDGHDVAVGEPMGAERVRR